MKFNHSVTPLLASHTRHYFGFFEKSPVARLLHNDGEQLISSMEELCLDET
jgi:hypothetical protein